jgi:glycosyltransferase involved in cell wall biosynthesis
MSHSLDMGGSERQAALVAQALDPTRFRVHVAAFHTGGMRATELRQAGIPVHEIPVRSFKNSTLLTGAKRFRQLIRDENIELVHPFDYPTVIFGIPLARLFGVRVAISSQRGERGFLGPGWQRLLRFTDRLVDRVAVNSVFVKNELIQSQGVPADRIAVLYNGLDTGQFHAEDRQRLPELRDATAVIGTVSVLRREKGIDSLIDAFARLQPAERGLRLLVAGGGEAQDELIAQAERMGVRGQCLFLPATKNVAPLYRSIDIYVLPSHTEAFSNSLLESIACGCCPVASRVGGNPEMVRDGENGFLFPPGNGAALADRLEVLLADPGRRQQFSAVGRQRIDQEFRMSLAGDRFGDFYRQLLG